MNYGMSRRQRASALIIAFFINGLVLFFCVTFELPYYSSHQQHLLSTNSTLSRSTACTLVHTDKQNTSLKPQSIKSSHTLPPTSTLQKTTTPIQQPSSVSSPPPTHLANFLTQPSPYQSHNMIKHAGQQEKKITQLPPSAKKKMNLAQIAKKFSLFMKKEGSPLPPPPSSRRTGDEIVMNIFGERVAEVLAQSMRRPPLLPQPSFRNVPRNCTVNLIVALNRDGSVKYLGLEESSGDKNVDAYVVSRFNQCNDKFPPLPRNFKQPVAILGFKIPLR